MTRALTIAGSDSSGGAGIQADLKVFAELGVYGFSAVTAVTAQNSQGLCKVNKVPPRIVAAQIDASVRDFGVDACKIGMLYSHQVVTTVAERLRRREIQNVVLDPVIFAKRGQRLITSAGVARMKREMLPEVLLIAPNIDESEVLTGLSDREDAARALHNMGAKFVLIKGGHLEGEPLDLLFDGERFTEYHGTRIQGKNVHGTGCILSSAITARIALGDAVPDAVGFAKKFTSLAVETSAKLGKGAMWYYTGQCGGRAND